MCTLCQGVDVYSLPGCRWPSPGGSQVHALSDTIHIYYNVLLSVQCHCRFLATTRIEQLLLEAEFFCIALLHKTMGCSFAIAIVLR